MPRLSPRPRAVSHGVSADASPPPAAAAAGYLRRCLDGSTSPRVSEVIGHYDSIHRDARPRTDRGGRGLPCAGAEDGGGVRSAPSAHDDDRGGGETIIHLVPCPHATPATDSRGADGVLGNDATASTREHVELVSICSAISQAACCVLRCANIYVHMQKVSGRCPRQVSAQLEVLTNALHETRGRLARRHQDWQGAALPFVLPNSSVCIRCAHVLMHSCHRRHHDATGASTDCARRWGNLHLSRLGDTRDVRGGAVAALRTNAPCLARCADANSNVLRQAELIAELQQQAEAAATARERPRALRFWLGTPHPPRAFIRVRTPGPFGAAALARLH